MQRFDNCSRCEEEQCLKEGVSEKMKDCCAPGTDAQCEKHVTDLADG